MKTLVALLLLTLSLNAQIWHFKDASTPLHEIKYASVEVDGNYFHNNEPATLAVKREDSKLYLMLITAVKDENIKVKEVSGGAIIGTTYYQLDGIFYVDRHAFVGFFSLNDNFLYAMKKGKSIYIKVLGLKYEFPLTNSAATISKVQERRL